MHRRLVAAALPALAVAFAWSRLELNPGAWPLLAAVAVGLTAALPRVLWQALGVAVTGTIGVVAVVLGGSPAGAGREAEHGLREFYAVALPFDGQRHTSMHALVMVAVACFAAALGVWAGRRPFAGAVCAAVGVGWPATLVPARDPSRSARSRSGLRCGRSWPPGRRRSACPCLGSQRWSPSSSWRQAQPLPV